MSKDIKRLSAQVAYKVEAISVDALSYENRCPHTRCNRILFKGILGPGTRIEIQCPKCKRMAVLSVVSYEE
jgi:phage FluMu protein Com